jgi:hypothetical protein
MYLFDRHAMLWQMFRTHTYFAAFVMALAGTAAADPKSPQCWDCLHEQGLTPGSVLPGLAQSSPDDGGVPTLQQMSKIFTDAQVEHGSATYVGDRLAQLPDVSADDRAKLVDGARQDLDTTLRHLVDHSCRLLLQSYFDEGASRVWILHMIELGQKSHEPS